MIEVITGNTPGRLLSADILDSMFRLRSAAFSDRLGWDVSSLRGREIDRFDDLDPTYMIARDRIRPQRALGCWRLLPTTGSYMLRDVFPELLDGNPVPRDPRVWEISRYAVTPDAGAIGPDSASAISRSRSGAGCSASRRKPESMRSSRSRRSRSSGSSRGSGSRSSASDRRGGSAMRSVSRSACRWIGMPRMSSDCPQ